MYKLKKSLFNSSCLVDTPLWMGDSYIIFKKKYFFKNNIKELFKKSLNDKKATLINYTDKDVIELIPKKEDLGIYNFDRTIIKINSKKKLSYLVKYKDSNDTLFTLDFNYYNFINELKNAFTGVKIKYKDSFSPIILQIDNDPICLIMPIKTY